jgi:hypothetical protein
MIVYSSIRASLRKQLYIYYMSFTNYSDSMIYNLLFLVCKCVSFAMRCAPSPAYLLCSFLVPTFFLQIADCLGRGLQIVLTPTATIACIRIFPNAQQLYESRAEPLFPCALAELHDPVTVFSFFSS